MGWYDKRVEFSSLVGVTLSKIEISEKSRDEINFYATDGRRWRMYHEQECCESVYIEDIVGDLEDLIGSPIVVAEKVSNSEDPCKEDDCDYSHTWTFYKIDTTKGGVTIRWYGTSNGYYSESVDFELVQQEEVR